MVLALQVLCVTDGVRSAVIEGVQFPTVSSSRSLSLPLRGVGLAKYLRVIKVYVAALYLDPTVSPERVLEDVPKRLELSYLRPLKAQDFARAAETVLPSNVSPTNMAGIRTRVEQLHRLFQDIEPGDRYSLTYVPGVGTELAHNEKVKGVIPGEDFAAAYFSIWLGPDPISPSLKDALLGVEK